MSFTPEHLPPGEYMCKIVDVTVEPGRKPGDRKAMLTVTVPALGDAKLKVEAGSFHGNVLDQGDIERLARVAWENTGKGDLPVLPAGHGWVDQATGKQIDLVTTWEKVGTKDIFRRQAAAVAQALGFTLAEDVKIKPRNLSGSDDDFAIEKFLPRDLLSIEVRRIECGRRALALLEPKTKEEMKSQIGTLYDGVRALQSLDDLGTEVNRRVFTAMDKIMAKVKRLEKELGK